MARGPGYRPLIVLRWIFLALLVIAVVVVVRLFLGRDIEAETPRTGREASTIDDIDDGEVVLAAEGFEYQAVEEGDTLFSIRAQRMVSDRQNRFVLEGVELSLEDEDGDPYLVESRRATYDLDSREALLEGAVRLSGPDGLALRGEGFSIRQRGKVLVNTIEPASFLIPGGYTGQAQYLRINLERHNLLMRGAVTIDSPAGAERPIRLTASRMLYQEAEGLLRSEGNVTFRRGEDRLSSRRLSVGFALDEGAIRGIRHLQASWSVVGRLVLDEGSDRRRELAFEAHQMVAEFDRAGKRVARVVFEEEEGDDARLQIDDGAGLAQTVRSRVIYAGFTDGAVSRVETLTPTVLEEGLNRAGAPPLRRLCGDSLLARLDAAGALGELKLEGNVDLAERGLAATAERLTGDPAEEILLAGAPAYLLTERSEFQAPEIVYSRRSGSIRARGGVRASGQEGAGVELAVADARAPVMVTAEEATWIREPPIATFAGKVRAWQGESFLLAERLTSFEEGERLEAVGSIKTVWKPPPDNADGRKPLEINAGAMDYRGAQRLLSYSGGVRVHETGRTMRCDELELTVDAERRIEKLVCSGNAVVEDPVTGRVVRGSETLYTPADRLLLISGQPVVLKERDGAEMQGRRLRYDLDSGEVRILSEPRVTDREPSDERQPSDG